MKLSLKIYLASAGEHVQGIADDQLEHFKTFSQRHNLAA